MRHTDHLAIFGTGLTLFGVAAPYYWHDMPTYLSLPAVVIGLAIMVLGAWPLLDSVRLGHLTVWRVPLLLALKICYEKCETLPMGAAVAQINNTAHTRLSFFFGSFIVHKVPIFGEKPPSRIARHIPPQEMKGLLLKEGTSDLLNLYRTEQTLYQNVYVRRPDLWRHVRLLKSVHGIEQA